MSECIKWHKSLNERGYGQIWVNGKHWKAHRLAWAALYGEIPEGMVIDHTCHNAAAAKGECDGGVCEHRACINIDHLELVSQGENVRRGLHGVDTKQTCPKGHSYRDARNVLVRKNGQRECAECNRVRAAAAYARKKEVA